jgi:G3E family GTPase
MASVAAALFPRSPERNFLMSNVERVPITLITGFLGSGKTAFITRLLNARRAERFACVVNEVGEIGLDAIQLENSIVANPKHAIVSLPNGCLCCVVKDDFVSALVRLGEHHDRDPAIFERVIVETSGLADPVALARTLMVHPLITTRFALDGAITFVDGVGGEDRLGRFPEAARQLVIADRVMISKLDLIDSHLVDVLKDQIRIINPFASISAISNRSPELQRELFALGRKTDNRQWYESLQAETGSKSLRHRGVATEASHSSNIAVLNLLLERAVSWDAYRAWLSDLRLFAGNRLLRVKGLLRCLEDDRPILVNGTQQIYDDPLILREWPFSPPVSRIVCIVEEPGAKIVTRSFNRFQDTLA